MKLYDEILEKCREILENKESRELPVGAQEWPQVSDSRMILRRDMAYELGGEGLPAFGCTLVTENKELVPTDRVTLIGKDLPEIQGDVPFGRIALVRIGQGALGEGQALYQALRNLEYTRYHFYPEGFMLRISSTKQRESVRVEDAALKKGLDFTKTGNQMIEAFHKNLFVEAVHLFYVTLEGFPYTELENCGKKAEEITRALDHIVKGGIMDCRACGLQKVCDEVEGLRKLHFQGKTRE